MTLQLRPEQEDVLNEVAAAFRAGHKRVMVSAFCGFGKTELATAMLKATYENGKRGAFLADRIALVRQTSARFHKYGLPHGVLQADHPEFRPSLPIQVCSIQTLIRRRWPEANVIFIDEAHVLAGPIRKKLEAKDCYAIGLSATPLTRGLGKYFDVVVNGPPANRLIEMGRLVPLRIHSYGQPNMEGVKVNSLGEWDDKQGEKRVLQVVGDVVQKYLQDGDNEKFILFAWNIAHAQELQRQFLAAGINCATYTANDQPEDRHEAVQEFKKPDSSIRGLLSVAALTRGFDETSVRLLIDARPLRKSLAEYVQMLGRVMRSHDGKEFARVFDHSGNALHFWSKWHQLFEHGVAELDDGKPKEKKAAEKKEVEPVTCPKCRLIHNPVPSCPRCGHEYPRKAAVQHVPGTLTELIATKDAGLLRQQLWPQVVGWVLEKTQDPERAQKRAQAIYYGLTGEFAKAKVESTTPVPPTREVRNKLLAEQIRWAKGRQGAERRA